jgi:hypothetical protein
MFVFAAYHLGQEWTCCSRHSCTILIDTAIGWKIPYQVMHIDARLR